MKSGSDGARRAQADLERDPVATLKAAHRELMQAESLRQQREFERAEKICLSLLERYPDYFGTLHTIGLICGEKGQPAQAIGFLVKAAMLNPRSWTTLTALAGEYLMLGAKEMAIRALRDALEINRSRPEIYVTLAGVYYEQTEYVLAFEACEKALELEPDFPAGLVTLARVCLALGRYNQARDALDRHSELEPPLVSVLAMSAQLPAPVLRRDLIADLDKAESQNNGTTAINQVQDAFIRTATYDKMRSHDDAWRWALKANALVLRDCAKQRTQELRSIEERATWLENNLGKLVNDIRSDQTYPTTLFILGPSRSGKTTAEVIISQQVSVFRGYENPAIDRATKYAYQSGSLLTMNSIAQLPYQLFPVVQEYYKEIICNLMNEEKIFTNTTPGYIWDAPLFLKAIPNSKFLFIKRDFHDVALRIFFKNYRAGNFYGYDIDGISRYINAYNKIIDLMVEAFPRDCVIVEYESLVQDSKAALDKMCKLCGIEADYGRLPEVADDIGCSEPYRRLMDAALLEC